MFTGLLSFDTSYVFGVSVYSFVGLTAIPKVTTYLSPSVG